MRVAIIALILAITALGVGSFATFTALDNDETEESVPVAAESGWSEAECADAQERLGMLAWVCRRGDCDGYTDILQAINDNCP